MVNTAEAEERGTFRASITDGLTPEMASMVMSYGSRWGWGLAGGLAAAMRRDLANARRT